MNGKKLTTVIKQLLSSIAFLVGSSTQRALFSLEGTREQKKEVNLLYPKIRSLDES